MEADTISYHIKDMTVTFGFESVLPVGTGYLDVTFVGELNNQMAGFYRSSYTDIHGNKKTMASTQFESIDARRCFPCWDEPSRKATFTVTMIHDPALSAISNMPESRSEIVGAKRKVSYLPTPKMST